MKEGGPHHTKGQLKDYVEWLKQSGRGAAIPELKRSHSNEFE